MGLATEWLVEQLRNGKELNDDLINEAKDIEQGNLKRKDVLVKDYEQDVAILKLLLSGVGIVTDYVTTDLLYECMKVFERKGGSSDLRDISELKVNHNKKWEKYFEELNKQTEETE